MIKTEDIDSVISIVKSIDKDWHDYKYSVLVNNLDYVIEIQDETCWIIDKEDTESLIRSKVEYRDDKWLYDNDIYEDIDKFIDYDTNLYKIYKANTLRSDIVESLTNIRNIITKDI